MSRTTDQDQRSGFPPAEPAPPSARPGPSAGPRSFTLVLGAAAVSSVGDGLAFVAFPLLATTLTRNAGLIAGVAVASRLPWLLVSLPAGVLADRSDRRRMATAVEIGRMAVLLVLGAAIALHRLDIAGVYLAAFSLGCFETGFVATTQAVLPEMVPPEELTRANGRLFAIQMTGEQFAGPALGGIAFAIAAAMPFVADGITFAASAVLLALGLPGGRRGAGGDGRRPACSGHHSMVAEVREGVVWLTRHAVLRLVAGLIATFAFCQMMGLAVLVVYGQRVLHLSGASYGVFVAGAAVGELVGGLAAHRLIARFTTGPILVSAGVVAATAFAVMGLTSSVTIAVAALAAEAFALGVGNVGSLSLRQSVIPTELAGRVSTALRMCISVAAALGGVAGGALAVVYGAHSSFLVGGALQLAGALVLGFPLARAIAAARPPAARTSY